MAVARCSNSKAAPIAFLHKLHSFQITCKIYLRLTQLPVPVQKNDGCQDRTVLNGTAACGGDLKMADESMC